LDPTLVLGPMRTRTAATKAFALLCAALLAPANPLLFADPEPDADPTSTTTTPAAPAQSAEQLDSLVAPIALYPDPLISQILVAATYPLEIVQAYQWLQQNSALKGEDLTTAAQKQPWDPSIQALVVFPDVMKRLNQDITWTTNLGNAFLAQQADVMDSIQRMRIKAQAAGKLSSTDQQKVVTSNDSGKTVVEIQPTNPQVIYVPYYDPAYVWGPDVYYPYPPLYYPAGAFFFGAGIFLGAAFVGCCGYGGWGWHPGWGRHTVIINQGFVRRYNFTTVHVRTVGGEAVWRHDAGHRLGVAYPNRGLATHYQAERSGRFAATGPAGQFHSAPGPGFHSTFRPNAAQVQGQLHSSAARVQASGYADRIGNRQIGTSGYNHNRSAFGGVGAGASARVHSDRGFSSLGRARADGHSFGGSHAAPATGGVGGGGTHGGSSGAGGGGHSGGNSGGGWGGGHGGGGGGHR
jgi:hypothetical protein